MPDFSALANAGIVERVNNALTQSQRITSLCAPAPGQDGSIIWRFKFLVDRKPPINGSLIIGADFPLSMPEFFVDGRYFGEWPHVEESGKLCLYEPSVVFKQSDVAGIIDDAVSTASNLVRASINGEYLEDFHHEMQIYWTWKSKYKCRQTIFSILEDLTTTRLVRVWCGERIILIAENDDGGKKWLSNYFGGREKPTAFNFSPCLLLSLGENTISPKDFPKTGAGINNILRGLSADSDSYIKEMTAEQEEHLLFVFSAETKHGPCPIASYIRPPKQRMQRSGLMSKSSPYNDTLMQRFLSAKAENGAVHRVDKNWVHGRDKNYDLERLSKKCVTILGCGSIGSFVADMLLQSGVGKINIFDGQMLEGANVSRHILGVDSVGLQKSLALQEKFKRSYPHATIEAWNTKWHEVENVHEILSASDMIIDLTADKYSIQKLNRWHLNENKRRIPVLYGQTENHAAAGFCITIGNSGGCMECALDDFGQYKMKITEWPEGHIHHEPGCGAEFVSYGAIELQNTIGLIAKQALSVLKIGQSNSELHCWVADRDSVYSIGGSWAETWVQHPNFADQGGIIFSEEICKSQDCPACR